MSSNSNDSPEQDLIDSLAKVQKALEGRLLQGKQFQMALQERREALHEKFSAELEAEVEDRSTGNGLSALNRLKIEALAYVFEFGMFHCAASHKLAEKNQHEESHCWAVDEGRIMAAVKIIEDIACP